MCQMPPICGVGRTVGHAASSSNQTPSECSWSIQSSSSGYSVRGVRQGHPDLCRPTHCHLRFCRTTHLPVNRVPLPNRDDVKASSQVHMSQRQIPLVDVDLLIEPHLTSPNAQPFCDQLAALGGVAWPARRCQVGEYVKTTSRKRTNMVHLRSQRFAECSVAVGTAPPLQFLPPSQNVTTRQSGRVRNATDGRDVYGSWDGTWKPYTAVTGMDF